MVYEFRSIVRHIATGYAGGGVFNGNANREVIMVPFLRNEIAITSAKNYDAIRQYG